ncbi:hypothetical protein Cal6303_3224 [Calothrix sp. PCC 6303]|nr:hypothetical protein Cal6303_3224 [Calothrix sp. PCC 6303]
MLSFQNIQYNYLFIRWQIVRLGKNLFSTTFLHTLDSIWQVIDNLAWVTDI